MYPRWPLSTADTAELRHFHVETTFRIIIYCSIFFLKIYMGPKGVAYVTFYIKFNNLDIMSLSIQWATLVTHNFFRAHIFWQKCWNRTFSMIIYLLTFYLFDNIEKKLLESLMRIILLKGNFDKF